MYAFALTLSRSGMIVCARAQGAIALTIIRFFALDSRWHLLDKVDEKWYKMMTYFQCEYLCPFNGHKMYSQRSGKQPVT